MPLAAWEKSYAKERTWEELEEDESGRLVAQDVVAQQRRHRRRQQEEAVRLGRERIRKGIIRYLVLAIDLSRAAGTMDLRPSRMAVAARCAERFIDDFFDQNPLSHVALIGLRNGVAVPLTDPSASPDMHKKALRDNMTCSGNASVQNALELGFDILSQIPSYGHREFLLVFSALSTCDPGEVMESIEKCKAAHIRCSVVGVAAEVYICKKLTEVTGGQYGVAKDEHHLLSLLLQHAPPPPVPPERATASLVRMGFPRRSSEASATAAAICACHVALQLGATYTCPRCKARICDLPTECRICGLTLVSSPQLARSYHHLFPVPPFLEASSTPGDPAAPGGAGPSVPARKLPLVVGREGEGDADGTGAGALDSEALLPQNCFGCLCPLPLPTPGVEVEDEVGIRLKCQGCKHHFCFDCDAYIHESLHNCPGCEAAGSATFEQSGTAQTNGSFA